MLRLTRSLHLALNYVMTFHHVKIQFWNPPKTFSAFQCPVLKPRLDFLSMITIKFEPPSLRSQHVQAQFWDPYKTFLAYKDQYWTPTKTFLVRQDPVLNHSKEFHGLSMPSSESFSRHSQNAETQFWSHIMTFWHFKTLFSVPGKTYLAC